MRRFTLTPSSRLLLISSIFLNVILLSSVWPFDAGYIPDLGGIIHNSEWDGGVGSLQGGSRSRGRGGCTMCSAAPDICGEVGEVKLEQAIGYAGSNDRLRRLLAKIRAGEPFTMGVIGGSVSQGAGIKWGEGDDEPREPWYRPENMHRRIFEHLQALSPRIVSPSPDIPPDDTRYINEQAVFGMDKKNEGKNGLINGALGGTGSGYFAYCWGKHVDPGVDLMVIELSINDEPLTRNINSYELLVRSLLDLPQKPAVISVEIFALLFDTIAFGGEMHKGINQFYDIPSISFRNPFLPSVMANFSEVERFFIRKNGKLGEVEGLDLRHMSHFGHKMTADLVKAYIDLQLCEMQTRGGIETWEETHTLADIPKMRLNEKYNPKNVVPALRPTCFSMTSPKNKIKPVKHDGWDIWSHGEKHYWRATKPGSLISIAFSTSIGEVQLHYLRSKVFGLGNVWCWVDEARGEGFRVEGWWNEVFNIAQSSSLRGLRTGDHLLHCEVEEGTADPEGGHEFRIISLTSI